MCFLVGLTSVIMISDMAKEEERYAECCGRKAVWGSQQLYVTLRLGGAFTGKNFGGAVFQASLSNSGLVISYNMPKTL